MKNKRRLALSLLGILVLHASSGYSQQSSTPETTPVSSASTPKLTDPGIKIGTASQKVPAGTMLNISFHTAMDARITQKGEPFLALLEQDFRSPQNKAHVILPKGSVIRGRVQEVKKPWLFSKGGYITLDFDHVILPTGDLLPLNLNLSATNDKVKDIIPGANQARQVALYQDPGIGHKVNKGAKEGAKTFNQINDASIEAGKKMAGGAGVIVTAPAGIVGGAVAGAAVTTSKAIVAVVGKGDTVIIQPGDTYAVDFGGAFNLPAE